MFSLSWVITWFSHVIEDTSSVLRLHDFFLASHPLMSLYVTAAVSLYGFYVHVLYPLHCKQTRSSIHVKESVSVTLCVKVSHFHGGGEEGGRGGGITTPQARPHLIREGYCHTELFLYILRTL